MSPTPSPAELFRTAADHLVALVAGIPDTGWDQPALGAWTVRALVGHTGRALSTVVEYLARPAAQREVPTTVDYYLAVAEHTDPQSIRIRGEHAGAALGNRPLTTIRALRDRAVDAVTAVDDPLVRTAAGGMLLSDYLPTRTFELAVHGLDLARATGQPETLPAEVTRAALHLAAELTLRRGDGEAALLALTGRRSLPAGFTVLREKRQPPAGPAGAADRNHHSPPSS